MIFVINDFEKKVNEVELYFDFMSDIVVDHASLCFENNVESEVQIISPDIQRILKANMFLLLYNLIESSFKDALVRLSDEINDSQLMYKNSIPEIRRLWIECEKDYFLKKPNNVKKFEYFYGVIENLREEILCVPNSLSGIDISGNIDAKKIRECMKRYGIPLNSHPLSNGDTRIQLPSATPVSLV